MRQCSAAVLSGGKNSRMGSNKAFAEIGNRKVIETIVEVLVAAFPDVMVVTNNPWEYEYLGIRVVSDRLPGCGPMGGIHAALSETLYPYCFVVACDMPFINPDLMAYMADLAPGYDVVVPQVGESLQPLYAVYGRNCLKPIETLLRQGIYKVYTFYPMVRVRFVPESQVRQFGFAERLFFGFNTPAELEKARLMVEKRSEA